MKKILWRWLMLVLGLALNLCMEPAPAPISWIQFMILPRCIFEALLEELELSDH